jgi:hypothetical protein
VVQFEGGDAVLGERGAERPSDMRLGGDRGLSGSPRPISTF